MAGDFVTLGENGRVVIPASVRQTLQLKKGDRLEISLESDSRYEVRINLAWGVRHVRAGKTLGEQQLDMRCGHVD